MLNKAWIKMDSSPLQIYYSFNSLSNLSNISYVILTQT